MLNDVVFRSEIKCFCFWDEKRENEKNISFDGDDENPLKWRTAKAFSGALQIKFPFQFMRNFLFTSFLQ
jgi:hypothetical protein